MGLKESFRSLPSQRGIANRNQTPVGLTSREQGCTASSFCEEKQLHFLPLSSNYLLFKNYEELVHNELKPFQFVTVKWL